MQNNNVNVLSENLVGKAGEAGKSFFQFVNPLKVFEEYCNYKKIESRNNLERDKVYAYRDKVVSYINSEKEIILSYFESKFNERKDILNQLYLLLHNAAENKNIEILDKTLETILGVVKDNPLKDFEYFKKARRKKQILEL